MLLGEFCVDLDCSSSQIVVEDVEET